MSTDIKDKSDDLVIQEADDGSAVIDLPDGIESPDQQDKAEGGEVAGDNHDNEEQHYDSSEQDSPNDNDEVRAAKREKRKARKEYHKQVQQEKDVRLQNLQRQNDQLLERLSIVERKTAGTELARLDKAIEDQTSRISFARQKMAEATQTGDGELLTQAQEMWFEARRQQEALTNIKRRAVAPQRAAPIQQPDPRLVRQAKNWMDNNSWYDPQGGDADSKIALTIDEGMVEDGWDPNTQDYWEELDNRLQKYLPHRYTSDVGEKASFKSRPRNVVTSSGRESSSSSGGKNSYVLSPDRVRAMKDAGLWDDPEKRKRMINRYVMEDKQNKGRN
jgi:hypothetical protein